MALPEIATVLTSFKAIAETTNSIFKMLKDVDPKKEALRDKAIELRGIITSLQSYVLSMHMEYSNLLQVNHDLEKKLMEYENWDKTKSQYKLEEVASGVFVYSLKEDNRISEPDHWLCTNCFDDRKKSILQRHGTSKYLCPNPKCRNEIIVPPGGSWD